MNLFKFSISDAITGTTILDVCVYHAAYLGDTYCDDSLNIVCTQLLNYIHIGGLSLSDQCSPFVQWRLIPTMDTWPRVKIKSLVTSISKKPG